MIRDPSHNNRFHQIAGAELLSKFLGLRNASVFRSFLESPAPGEPGRREVKK